MLPFPLFMISTCYLLAGKTALDWHLTDPLPAVIMSLQPICADFNVTVPGAQQWGCGRAAFNSANATATPPDDLTCCLVSTFVFCTSAAFRTVITEVLQTKCARTPTCCHRQCFEYRAQLTASTRSELTSCCRTLLLLLAANVPGHGRSPSQGPEL